MRLKDIIRDEDIYPRVQISQKTIESYVEAIKAGAKFPKIEAQRIRLGDNKIKTICLDGWHRLEAYRLYNKQDGVQPIEDVETAFWKDEILNKDAHLVELMVRAYECNAKQGFRPSTADARAQLEKIARLPNSLNLSWKDVAKSFEVTPQWVSECVSSILAEKRMSRDAFIYKLCLLGFTQTEIGEMVDMAQPHISESIQKLNQLKLGIISDFYEKHKSTEKISEYYKLDMPLTWAILLEGKDDVERFKLFGNSEYGDEQPEMSDYWKFNQRDPQLGQNDYPGNLYGQEALNIIYRFSRQGDLIVDPMAGGGTTIDACLILGRKCRAFDIDPSKSGRKDILKHDITQGYPEKARSCHLIVIDPPYYKKKEAEYGNFSKDRVTFLQNLAKLAKDSYETVRPKGYVALLYGQYIEYEDELLSIFSYDLGKLFEQAGFRLVLNIQSPLTFNNQWHGDSIEKAKQDQPWKILPVSKDWQIFKRI